MMIILLLLLLLLVSHNYYYECFIFNSTPFHRIFTYSRPTLKATFNRPLFLKRCSPSFYSSVVTPSYRAIDFKSLPYFTQCLKRKLSVSMLHTITFTFHSIWNLSKLYVKAMFPKQSNFRLHHWIAELRKTPVPNFRAKCDESLPRRGRVVCLSPLLRHWPTEREVHVGQNAVLGRKEGRRASVSTRCISWSLT